MEELYLKSIYLNIEFDQKGLLFSKIISIDVSFLYRYLDNTVLSERNYTIFDCRLQRIWESEEYIDLADRVFDHCYCKRNESSHSLRMTPESKITSYFSDPQKVIEKQNQWIEHTIEKYNQEDKRMEYLFDVIHYSSSNRHLNALKKFLSLNQDFNAFRNLPFFSYISRYCGYDNSYVKNIGDFLNSICYLLSDKEYLEHKVYLEEVIKAYYEDIKDIEEREFLNQ